MSSLALGVSLCSPVARRGSLLYFLLDSLSRIQSMYQFSLSAFDVVFSRAIDQSAAAEDLKERIHNLLDCTTYSVFNYARRGLFEKHKLIFSAQLAFRILIQENRVNREELDWLIRGSKVDTGSGNPLADWVSESSWTSLCALKQLEAFHKIVDDIEGSQKRWMEWASLDKPEVEKLPGEWKVRRYECVFPSPSTVLMCKMLFRTRLVGFLIAGAFFLRREPLFSSA